MAHMITGVLSWHDAGIIVGHGIWPQFWGLFGPYRCLPGPPCHRFPMGGPRKHTSNLSRGKPMGGSVERVAGEPMM